MQHLGTISKITDSTITVALEANINCEGCKAKAACGVSESNAKEIEIENTQQISTTSSTPYNLYEEVAVIMEESKGLKAVFWAYIFPFILMISTLFISSLFVSEAKAGILSLVALLPYYLLIFLLNSFFKKRFKVTLFKLT
ncbi:SoxR reducing system RseC family protein [Lutimonas sp.]|uniref:SoxR reducing system RseC family protein n=1 Tax=Lutimonas sp. TaxID=1872403 RepID=UPI003D9B457D